jgi:hypothetical protein
VFTRLMADAGRGGWSHPPVRLLPAMLAAGLVLAGCAGEPETTSKLEILSEDGGAGGEAPLGVRATWTYRSSDVDVDATLVTEEDEAGCSTSGRLAVNEALATTDVYYLPQTDCSVLRLTETGDIVMYESPTGHDWSTEELRVDTDRELIELGPWSPDAMADAYRFILSAPACGNGCSCPSLRRRSGSEELVLELSRDCG